MKDKILIDREFVEFLVGYLSGIWSTRQEDTYLPTLISKLNDMLKDEQ